MAIMNHDLFQLIINILCAIAFSAIGYKFNTLTTEIKNLRNIIDCLKDYIEHLPRQK